jgi:cytidylate kinase
VIIAIDGPAAAGKGTLAKRVAEALGFAWLDTGSLYRAVALMVLRAGGDPGDPAIAAAAARQLTAAMLDDPDVRAALREERVGQAASVVAAQPDVRTALLDFQRAFAGRPPRDAPGAVLDGRDIGTVVCPNADVKVFVTASAEERARRRHAELLGRGEAADYATILAATEERDARDAGRDTAPMRAASDAYLLDTTDLSIDAAFAALMSYVEGAQD